MFNLRIFHSACKLVTKSEATLISFSDEELLRFSMITRFWIDYGDI